MKKSKLANNPSFSARTVTVLCIFLSLTTTALAFPLPTQEPTRAMRYCTDAGTTYYCLLNLAGNTINGKTCSFGDVNKNNGQAIKGGDIKNLDLCIQYCSDWACYHIKDQQNSAGKPVVGSPCCNRGSWTTSR